MQFRVRRDATLRWNIKRAVTNFHVHEIELCGNGGRFGRKRNFRGGKLLFHMNSELCSVKFEENIRDYARYNSKHCALKVWFWFR